MNAEKPIVYYISGLSADHRIYQFLVIDGYESKAIEWAKHEEYDTMASYASKLIQQIDTTKPVVLIGTSLGGMMSIEIAKQIKVEHTFLISSIKTRFEQPAYFKFFRSFPMYEWLPNSVMGNPDFFMRFLFPAGMKKEWKELFADMFSKWSPAFLRWAMKAALNWNNETKIENYTHFHGDNDLVFPHKHIQNFQLIHGGTHIMVITKAREIKKLIEDTMNKKFL